ncbi:hypothetical protein CRD60_03370 [Bifidobacterium aemilianum]|uniref:SpaA-like prealbumin fold domain-containing protein n=1 Tax=Bifidobacterium aemilianum TaxID=2493120 RepID=A0A366KAC9_9BIFI|nr:isopeptide-forming domain-containing fimbrial protein [Bifidobacterium aemilianum]RBP98192.1 hypothetical protein CRD60_03370 [Bifidobacterium aemilianum]
MRKLSHTRGALGLVLSAAMVLGLSLAGAGTASAAEEQIPAADLEGTTGTLAIKGKGKAMNGHKFTAVRIGTYLNAAHDGSDLTAVAVGTDSAMVAPAEAALTTVTGGPAATGFAGNPVGEVASKWLGFNSTAAGSGNQDTTSNAEKPSAWDGKLRSFVTALAQQSDFQSAIESAPVAQKDQTPATVAADADAELTFNGLAQGLYLVEDTTAPGNTDTQFDTASIPMMLGTPVAATASPSFAGYTKFKGETAAVELGTVMLKNNVPSLSKKVVVDPAKGSSVSIGDYVHYRVTASVPLTTGFPIYKYSITDKPSAGLTVIDPSDATHGVRVYVASDEAGIASSTPVADSKYAASMDASDHHLVVDLTSHIKESDPYEYGKTIFIDYWMQVNDAATSGTVSNGVSLEYSNDPANPPTNNDGTGGSTVINDPDTKDLSNVYFYSFSVQKKAKADGSSLSGAQFQIKDKSTGTSVRFMKVGNPGGVVIPGSYKKAADQSAANTNATDTLEVSDGSYTDAGKLDKGLLKIDGLADGTYTVAETKAPEGFSGTFKPSFDEKIETRVNAGKADASKPLFSNTNDTWGLVAAVSMPVPGVVAAPTAAPNAVDVLNVNSISQLPLTGGAGIFLALLLALLFLAAGICLAVVKRHGSEIQG